MLTVDMRAGAIMRAVAGASPKPSAEPARTASIGDLRKVREHDASDEAAGKITQINVRHSHEGPEPYWPDEKFFGIAGEEKGKCVFNHKCDAWVSEQPDGTKGGICGSTRHGRHACDNPKRVDAKVTG